MSGPKQPKLKSPGKCIFDGRGGLTKAHIFPDWLGSHIPERTSRHIHSVGIFETFTPETRTPQPSTKIRQGDTGTRKVRKVCGACNSGWLGSLETPAKPHVLALMNGDDVAIDPVMQNQLAAWLCAIVILIDADSRPEGQAIPQDDRNYFMENRLPPTTWKIWLARYEGQNWQNHRTRRSGMRVQTTPEPGSDRFICNTQVTTLVLRRLCAHIFSSTVMDLPGYEGVDLQQIWPLTGNSYLWRRAPLLNDEAVVILSEALARDLKQIK